jgi:hypothetical protein
MVLPAGINKASGLEAVVKELGLSLHNVVGDLRAGSDTKAAPAQRRDEFPVGYSLAGLLSSRADLRFANCVPVSIRGLWESRSFQSIVHCLLTV